MSTPSDNNNSTNNQDNDKTAQLYSALILYIVLGTIVFLIFIIIRPRLKRVFGVNPMSKFPRKYVRWIPKLFRKTSEDTISKFGLDVEIALLVHKTLIYMVACYTFFAIVFILPVDATASGRQTGMNAYTISNIAPTEMERYAVHILGIIFNTIITCFFVLRMYKMYALFRRREKTKEKLHNFTVCITQTKDYTPQEIFNYFDQIFPGEVIDIWRVEDLDSTIDLKEKRIQYVYGLENARAKNIGSARKVPRSLDSCLCCQPCCCLAKKVPAEDFYLDRINTIENEIQEKQVNANYTKIVYVTFRHISTAMECVQLFMIMGRPHMAPELYDVRWKNHSISYRTIAPRSWITGIILLFLFLFWTAIIAFATTFSNINTLANYIPPLGLIPVEAKAFIGSIVPPIIIILSFTILKFIITALMDKTGPLSHSRLDRYVFRKLFLFYAINVFLVSLLANTFLETWNKIVNTTTALSPIDILLLLASSVGVQSTFFMIYILAQSFTHIIGLLHLGDIIVGGFKRWRAVTPREKLAASLPSHYPFHIDMAKQCLIFLVILNFSTISPLILPIGLVYLCFIYFQVAFDTTYTSFQEYDGFGSIFPDIAHRILFSLFFHQILMAGMFIISTFYIGLIFCGLCVIGTALFIYYTLGYYEKVSKYGLVDDVIGDARKVMKRGTDGRGYVHPGMWDATIDLEDVNRLSYSIKTAQNQGVEAP